MGSGSLSRRVESCSRPSAPRAGKASLRPSGEMATVVLAPVVAAGPRSMLNCVNGWSTGRVARHAIQPAPIASTAAAVHAAVAPWAE